MDSDMYEELKSAAENFQQGLVILTGPAHDGDNRLMANAYKDGLKNDDLSSFIEWMREMVENAENAAQEMQYALDEFETAAGLEVF